MSCNVDLWMNGVILSSVGSGLIITALVMKNSMKHVQKEQNTENTVNIKAKLVLKEKEEIEVIRSKANPYGMKFV